LARIVVTDEAGAEDQRATVTITLSEQDGGTHVHCASEPAFPGPASKEAGTLAQHLAMRFLKSLGGE